MSPAVRYRVTQFFAATRASELDAAALDDVRAILPPRGVQLFQTMPPGDQQHSLKIMRGLRANLYTARPLLQAALLHDSAKADIGIAYRAAVILLNALSPRLLPRFASDNPRSWRHPFYVSLHHPELSAALAQNAGVDPRAVVLIRRHQFPLSPSGGIENTNLSDRELETWQRALKELDDQN